MCVCACVCVCVCVYIYTYRYIRSTYLSIHLSTEIGSLACRFLVNSQQLLLKHHDLLILPLHLCICPSYIHPPQQLPPAACSSISVSAHPAPAPAPTPHE